MNEYGVKATRKLIGVALPLKEINEASHGESRSATAIHPHCIRIGPGVFWLPPGGSLRGRPKR